MNFKKLLIMTLISPYINLLIILTRSLFKLILTKWLSNISNPTITSIIVSELWAISFIGNLICKLYYSIEWIHLKYKPLLDLGKSTRIFQRSKVLENWIQGISLYYSQVQLGLIFCVETYKIIIMINSSKYLLSFSPVK